MSGNDKTIHVSGSGPIAAAVCEMVQASGAALADALHAHWLVSDATDVADEAPALLTHLRTQADRDGVAGIVLILDLSHAQPRAGEAPPPFAPALAQRTLAAAVPMLALALAPRIRVNAIGVIPERPGTTPGTPTADIAAALRFIIDAPALTGQMIALDGGRTALVPTAGLGIPDCP